jgi:hypothetical protein
MHQLVVYLWLVIQCQGGVCEDGNTHYRELFQGEKGAITYPSHTECDYTGARIQVDDPKVDGYMCTVHPIRYRNIRSI